MPWFLVEMSRHLDKPAAYIFRVEKMGNPIIEETGSSTKSLFFCKTTRRRSIRYGNFSSAKLHLSLRSFLPFGSKYFLQSSVFDTLGICSLLRLTQV